MSNLLQDRKQIRRSGPSRRVAFRAIICERRENASGWAVLYFILVAWVRIGPRERSLVRLIGVFPASLLL